jgi:hypothetical protein
MRTNSTNQPVRWLTRGLPTATVLSMTAAATLSMAGTASASTPTGDHGAKMKADLQAWMAAHPSIVNRLAKQSASTQSESPLVADFGGGKAAIPVEAMPGTFPSSLTPVFDGLDLEASYTNTNFPVPVEQCELMANASASPITTNDPDDCIIDVPEGATYTVSPGDTATVPAGFLLPAAVTGSMTDAVASTCTVAPSSDDLGFGDIPYCVGPTVEVPGIWNPITLTVTNSITGQPVKGATYILLGPDQSPPQTSLKADSSTTQLTPVLPPLATATTDSAGHLRFPSVYLGGDYTVSQIKGPKGYLRDNNEHHFTTPTVTSLAQAGKTFNKALTLKPQAPNLNNDASGGAFGAKQTIHVLANDSTPVGSLTVTSVSKPAHGTLHRQSNGTYVYKPAANFAGTDHFTYTARNSLGASSSARVTVIVHPAVVVQGEGAVLPFTGLRTGPYLDAGLISLALGALLTAAGGLRRRTT